MKGKTYKSKLTHFGIHGSTNHDVTETDTTQPGMVNKSGMKSYVDSVMGNNGKHKHSTTTNYLDNVIVHDEDCIVERDGSFPIVRFSDRVHDQIDQCMRNVLVLRLLGHTIGFKTLLSRIQMLWKHVVEFHLIDIDNNYFLVQFASEQDYMKVLMGGPWTIYGNYLTIQIAEAVGNVVKVDYNTLEGERGKFARLALLVDLNKPKYGHAHELCESRSTTETDTLNGESLCPIKENSASPGVIGTELYGPWMNAGTRRRKPRVANDSTRSVNIQAPIAGGSRFSVLETVEDDQEPMVDVSLPKRNSLTQQEKVSITTSTSEAVGPAHPIRHNPAYLASNPEKRSKAMKTKASGVIVVPMVVHHVSNKIVEIGNQVGSIGSKQRLLTLENESVLVSNSDSGADDEDMTVSVVDDTEALHERALVQGHGRMLILAHIKELLRQNWLVEFRSIHRERNSIAYTLAKLVCLRDLNYTWFVEPPVAVRLLLQKKFPYGNTTTT
ncbi:hypothetical protein GQ457_11G000710 [Hibiscus cannabinus]